MHHHLSLCSAFWGPFITFEVVVCIRDNKHRRQRGCSEKIFRSSSFFFRSSVHCTGLKSGIPGRDVFKRHCFNSLPFVSRTMIQLLTMTKKHTDKETKWTSGKKKERGQQVGEKRNSHRRKGITHSFKNQPAFFCIATLSPSLSKLQTKTAPESFIFRETIKKALPWCNSLPP